MWQVPAWTWTGGLPVPMPISTTHSGGRGRFLRPCVRHSRTMPLDNLGDHPHLGGLAVSAYKTGQFWSCDLMVRGVSGHQRVQDDKVGAARFLALSDGVFAIAMTLLALDITLPDGLDAAGFRHALGEAMPKLWAYALSFAVIAAFWRGHHQIFRYAQEADGTVIRAGLLCLGLIAIMPFPTTLLAEYGDLPQAVAVYSGAVAAVGAAQLALTVAMWKRPWLGSAGQAGRRKEDCGLGGWRWPVKTPGSITLILTCRYPRSGFTTFTRRPG
jgi:uncharacterized membrane protein